MKQLNSLVFALIAVLLFLPFYIVGSIKNTRIFKPNTPPITRTIDSSPSLIFEVRPIVQNSTLPKKYYAFSLDTYKYEELSPDDKLVLKTRSTPKQSSFMSGNEARNILNVNDPQVKISTYNFTNGITTSNVAVTKAPDGTTTYYALDQVAKNFRTLVETQEDSCGEILRYWSEKTNQLMFATRTTALDDSSSTDLTELCIYNYVTDTVDYVYRLPQQPTQFYYTEHVTPNLEKIVVEGTNNLVVLDPKEKTSITLPNTRILTGTALIIYQKGYLISFREDSENAYLEIRDLVNSSATQTVSLNKSAIWPTKKAYFTVREVANTPEDTFILEANSYEPYDSCWFLVKLNGDNKQLTCSSELYNRDFGRNYNFANFRMELKGYNKGRY